NGGATVYAWDELNRLAHIEGDPPGFDLNAAYYTYDANGNVTSMSDQRGTQTYVWDALNRATSAVRTTTITDTFTYGYDPAGNLTSRTYPGQSAQIWVYDDDGRLTSANGQTYTYDAAANLKTAVTPDGITARDTFDRAGR